LCNVFQVHPYCCKWQMAKFHCLILFIYLFIYLFEVLGFELRPYTLSHSTSPFFVKVFFQDRVSICPGVASNWDPLDLCLLNS
jgi:hypothetical protein